MFDDEYARLDAFGEFPGGLPTANTTEQSGGRVARCTIGDYWANQGIAPCVSIGSTTFFRTGQSVRERERDGDGCARQSSDSSNFSGVANRKGASI